MEVLYPDLSWRMASVNGSLTKGFETILYNNPHLSICTFPHLSMRPHQFLKLGLFHSMLRYQATCRNMILAQYKTNNTLYFGKQFAEYTSLLKNPPCKHLNENYCTYLYYIYISIFLLQRWNITQKRNDEVHFKYIYSSRFFRFVAVAIYCCLCSGGYFSYVSVNA